MKVAHEAQGTTAVWAKSVKLARRAVNTARIVRFLCVGCAAAGIYIVLGTGLVERLYWPPGFASCVAYGISIPVAYLAQKAFTFSSQSSHRVAFPRYIALQIASLVLASVFAEVTSQAGQAPPVFSFLFAAVVAVIFNYLVMSRWVFVRR